MDPVVLVKYDRPEGLMDLLNAADGDINFVSLVVTVLCIMISRTPIQAYQLRYRYLNSIVYKLQTNELTKQFNLCCQHYALRTHVS